MVATRFTPINWRACAPVIALLLLLGCSAPPAEQVTAQQVFVPLDASVTTLAAAQAGNPNLGIAYPAADNAVNAVFPLTAAEAAPAPPFAPARTGTLVTARDIARAQAQALLPTPTPSAPAAEGSTVPAVPTMPTAAAVAAAAPDTAAPDTAAPQPRIAADGGVPFDWATSENYLVLGTDRRAAGGSWRTDSIMVIGLDRAHDRAAVFSVPRDLYIEIPGYGFGRVNQADYMGEKRTPDGGGPALVSSILQEQLGISTQHWVRIQMDGFIQFIDALGGVDVYLDCPFSEPILNLNTNAWTNFTLPAGMNHLDGQDAYWFARLRYRETDIGRSSRQRAIIWALRDKILSTNAIMRLPQLYAAFRDTISTDLSLFDIIGLAQFAVSLKPENVRAGGLTLKDLQDYTTPGGAQVLIINDPDRVRALVTGIWDQPAMADAYRKDGAKCTGGIAAPEPNATPAPPTDPPTGEPAPDATAAPQADSTTSALHAPTGGFSAASATPLPLTGPVVDPVTGALFDLATGYPLDPATGQPFDPVTGKPIDAAAH